MWNLYGIEPELIDYSNLTVVSPRYILRPEIVESAFYLHYFTHQPRYLTMGQTFFNALVKCCRVDAGYSRLTDVTTKEKDDQQDSFLLAEDFKYYYLLFSPEPVLDLGRVVFNTEAHPLLRLKGSGH
jgi:ER degradation enhancer, mannosidase alpha-like 2